MRATRDGLHEQVCQLMRHEVQLSQNVVSGGVCADIYTAKNIYS